MNSSINKTDTALACNWILPAEAIGLEAKKLILFGDGTGSEEERLQFYQDFHKFSLKELCEFDCLIVARK